MYVGDNQTLPSLGSGRQNGIALVTSSKIPLKRKPVKLTGGLPSIICKTKKSQKPRRKGSFNTNSNFKYKVCSGNNCRVIMSALRKRPWWHPLPSHENENTTSDDVYTTLSLYWEMYRNPNKFKNPSFRNIIYNHLEFNAVLVTKKGLYESIRRFCEAHPKHDINSIIPKTFYINSTALNGEDDLEAFKCFNLNYGKEHEEKVDTTLGEDTNIISSCRSVTALNENITVSDGKGEADVLLPLQFPQVVTVEQESSAENLGNVANETVTGANPGAYIDAVCTASQSNVILSPPPCPNPTHVSTVGVSTTSENSPEAVKTDVMVPIDAILKTKAIEGTSAHSPRRIVVKASTVVENTIDIDKEGGIRRGPEDTVWILKPASLTNRGFGISVVRGMTAVLESIANNKGAESDSDSTPSTPSEADTSNKNKNTRRAKPTESSLERAAGARAAANGWIVQEYMERPLLVHGRKFDIRCYVVLTFKAKGQELHGYFYNDAYVRTSGKKYNLNRLEDRETHLTNDAVQKNSKNYGKFEYGNKLSLRELQQTILEDYPGASPTVVADKIFPTIKKQAALSISACKDAICKSTFPRSFELLGYDFMIDARFEPTLIEINSNPCLDTSCPILSEMIPKMISNVINISVDTWCRPQKVTVGNTSDGPVMGYTASTEEALRKLEQEEDGFEELPIINGMHE